MDRKSFAFDKKNFILLGIGMVIIIIGFLLMSGPGSTETAFEPDIFSVRRIKIAPAVCFFGFIFMIYGILRKPKDMNTDPTDKSTDIIEK
ncbi:DUF3098 domain-containing protein [Phocaeicola barnesiae]|jgi:membrane-bound ClpP family serine protease|uniref:DUF3098 domain-containing protein n=1 Tax=Phocaeicola barnesiae TaxID=376804 RepID=UPI0025A46AE7|nr:DUF3098 domain-containing protein [Phocaeicola barnesiae]MDM8241937.1 DUF3098 domain-containing protein [Phocaeicola barnesiae]